MSYLFWFGLGWVGREGSFDVVIVIVVVLIHFLKNPNQDYSERSLVPRSDT